MGCSGPGTGSNTGNRMRGTEQCLVVGHQCAVNGLMKLLLIRDGFSGEKQRGRSPSGGRCGVGGGQR